MKIKYFIPLLVLSITPHQVSALVCPDKAAAPKCPTSGNTILDETFPTQAYVISNHPVNQTKESDQTTQKFVTKIINSHDYKNVPQIVLSVKNEIEFYHILNQIKKDLTAKKLPKNQVDTILAQITHLPLNNYTWQQDWFESFTDPKTGNPRVRQIASYDRVAKDSGKALSQVGAACGVTSGEDLQSGFLSTPDPRVKYTSDYIQYGYSFLSGEMGGNIEGAPGGFCVVGDNAGKRFHSQFCGDDSNVIQIKTSFLRVGHVDEIFKIIPTQHQDGRPKECQFSVMTASPKKAYELMTGQNAKKQAYALVANTASSDDFKKSRSATKSATNLLTCNYINHIVKNKNGGLNSIPNRTKNVLFKLIQSPSLAQASDYKPVPQFKNIGEQEKFLKDLDENCTRNIDKITNFEMLQVMNLDQETIKLNMAIEESIAADRKQIKDKILSRLPQCAIYYDDLLVPNLFSGGETYVEKKSGRTLPVSPSTNDALLPNPTNGVLMNKTVVFPDSENGLYNDYLKEEMQKRNMKADFIPTWDYAHLGSGNLHCASHSMLYCNPN